MCLHWLPEPLQWDKQPTVHSSGWSASALYTGFLSFSDSLHLTSTGVPFTSQIKILYMNRCLELAAEGTQAKVNNGRNFPKGNLTLRREERP